MSVLLYLDLLSDLPGSDACRRLAIEHCQPMRQPRRHRGHAQIPICGTDAVHAQHVFPRRPGRTTSLKTTSRPPSNGWKWSRSQVISQYVCEVASSWCYARRNGRDSPNPPGSEKWISTSPAPTSFVIGPQSLTSTAKPISSTVECGSGRESASSPAATGNGS